MNFVMTPGLVKARLNEFNRRLEEIRGMICPLRVATTSFVNRSSPPLQGLAYDALRNYMLTNYTDLDSRYTAAIDALIEENNRHISLIDTHVGMYDHLNMDLINQEIEDIERQIALYEAWCGLEKGQTECGRNLYRNYQEIIRLYQNRLNEQIERRDRFNRYLSESAGLYSNMFVELNCILSRMELATFNSTTGVVNVPSINAPEVQMLRDAFEADKLFRQLQLGDDWNWDKIEGVFERPNISTGAFDALALAFTLMTCENELTRFVRLLGIPTGEVYTRFLDGSLPLDIDNLLYCTTWILCLDKIQGLISALDRMYAVEYFRFFDSEMVRLAPQISEMYHGGNSHFSTAPEVIWNPMIPIVDRLSILTMLAEVQSSGAQFGGTGGHGPNITIEPGNRGDGRGGYFLTFFTAEPLPNVMFDLTPGGTGHGGSHITQSNEYFVNNAAFRENIGAITAGNARDYVRVDVLNVIFTSMVESAGTATIPPYAAPFVSAIIALHGAYEKERVVNEIVDAFMQGLGAVDDRSIVSVVDSVGSAEQRIIVYPTHYDAGRIR